MTDVHQLFARQAAWQRSRENLSWEEKVRLAEAALPGLREWRSGIGPTPARTDTTLSTKPNPAPSNPPPLKTDY